MVAGLFATGVPGRGDDVMFTNMRKNPGLAGLLAVALVIAGYMAGAALAVKTYVEAGGPPAAAGAQCQVVCAPVAQTAPNG
jgi:hypothetical protein